MAQAPLSCKFKCGRDVPTNLNVKRLPGWTTPRPTKHGQGEKKRRGGGKRGKEPRQWTAIGGLDVSEPEKRGAAAPHPGRASQWPGTGGAARHRGSPAPSRPAGLPWMESAETVRFAILRGQAWGGEAPGLSTHTFRGAAEQGKENDGRSSTGGVARGGSLAAVSLSLPSEPSQAGRAEWSWTGGTLRG